MNIIIILLAAGGSITANAYLTCKAMSTLSVGWIIASLTFAAASIAGSIAFLITCI